MMHSWVMAGEQIHLLIELPYNKLSLLISTFSQDSTEHEILKFRLSVGK